MSMIVASGILILLLLTQPSFVCNLLLLQQILTFAVVTPDGSIITHQSLVILINISHISQNLQMQIFNNRYFNTPQYKIYSYHQVKQE